MKYVLLAYTVPNKNGGKLASGVEVRGVRLSEMAEAVTQFSFFKTRLRLVEGKFGMAVYNYFKVAKGPAGFTL
jgi:hypothetical protein